MELIPISKSTNINYRVTPTRKARIIERAGYLGLNLSDYIGHVIDKNEANSGENAALRAELTDKAKMLQRYEDILEPLFGKLSGRKIALTSGIVTVSNKEELLNLIVQNFKTTEKCSTN